MLESGIKSDLLLLQLPLGLQRVQLLITLNSLWPLLALKLRTQTILGTELFIRILFIWMESRCAPEDDIQAVLGVTVLNFSTLLSCATHCPFSN